MKIEEDQIKIIDNFLPNDIFKEFQSIFLDSKFPWYFSDYSVDPGDKISQFCHAIYMDMEPISYCWEYIKPVLINGLELKNHQSILRVKVNATPSYSSILSKKFHYDIVEDDGITVSPHNVAIIYINTNDGFTYFKDGAKVESIENRCVIFPGNLMHAGSTCTNSPVRIVLNVDYTCK
jgi:hypothetical protein